MEYFNALINQLKSFITKLGLHSSTLKYSSQNKQRVDQCFVECRVFTLYYPKAKWMINLCHKAQSVGFFQKMLKADLIIDMGMSG